MELYAQMLPMDSPVIEPGFDFNCFMQDIETNSGFEAAYCTTSAPAVNDKIDTVSSPDSCFGSNESSLLSNELDQGVSVRIKCSNSAEPSKRIHVTRSMLEQYFHESIDSAALKIGIGKSTMKVICRRLGVKRWPYTNKGVPRKRRAAAISMSCLLRFVLVFAFSSSSLPPHSPFPLSLLAIVSGTHHNECCARMRKPASNVFEKAQRRLLTKEEFAGVPGASLSWFGRCSQKNQPTGTCDGHEGHGT
eukprot:760720-Hanusia_phi.AAC.2